MPKITSLSEQLKRLQVPQTNLLSTINDHRRVSFLYEPKEAANLDSEAVYSIALNGLEQLKSIDKETFETFEQTLFNSTSLTFERAIQTKDVNEKLNSELKRFLIHLSPYFMLKPAHKALEWLVYRYQIHLYNINELFLCILPYHETNYFVRALQMIDFDKTRSEQVQLWSWLLENQKQGVQLSSQTLATRLYSDLSLLNYIIDYLNEALKHFGDEDSNLVSEQQQKHWMNGLNFVFSFLTKLFIQSVKNLSQSPQDQNSKKNFNNKQHEAFFAQLLPVLFNGFRSEFIPYKQTSYLVICFLFEKFKFTTETTNKALFAICKGLAQFRNKTENHAEMIDCLKSSILAICLILQSQYDDSQNQNELISKNFLKKLLKNFGSIKDEELLLETIDNLNCNYRIDKFLKCFLNRFINEMVDFDHENSGSINISLDLESYDDLNELKLNDKNEYFKLLLKMINLFGLNRMPSLIDSLLTNLFAQCVKAFNKTGFANQFLEYHLCELIIKLELKTPVQFDSFLNKFLLTLSREDKQKFLNLISSKFSCLRCKTAFKYQQLENDLNLLVSLNHSNPNLRSNALSFVLSQIGKKDANIDNDFVKSQLEAKFRNENFSIVYEQILKFGSLLLSYFSLEDLIQNENFLPKLFTDQISGKIVNQQDSNEEIDENLESQNREWSSNRELALDLIFTSFYKQNQEKNELFFSTFLEISTRLFELGSPQLINHLKSTLYYKKLQSDTHTDQATSIKKRFYTSSSITITKLNGHEDETINELNDLFESFLQICVKYMLSNENKAQNLVNQPKIFDLLTHRSSQKVNLLHFVLYEICVRLCAQSLFMTNPAQFLTLSVDFVTNLIGSQSYFNLKLKKTKQEQLETEFKRLSAYLQISLKQSIKSHTVLLHLYSQLFKSVSIQNSNFVNKNTHIELENILNKVYINLCCLGQENSIFNHIMTKFMQSNCFHNHQTPSHTPTKHSGVTNLTQFSFYQFIFKFLFDSNELVTDQTISLLNQNLEDFIEHNKKSENMLLNSLVLALTWCMAKPSQSTRIKSLNLLTELSSRLEEDSIWKAYLKKILKHRKEIEVDGTDYVRTKSLNKILAQEDLDLMKIVLDFLEFSLNKNKSILKPAQYNQFVSNSDSELDSECSILTKFKLCLLDLFKFIKDDFKLKFMDVLFSLLVSLLNESSSLLENFEKNRNLIDLNKSIIDEITSNYLITKKSSEFLNKNEKYFDYVIGYMNNQNQSQSTLFIRYFKQSLIKRLNENTKLNFFQQLEQKKQLDLLKCLFDLYLFNSSQQFEANLATSVEIEQNIFYLDTIKNCFYSFDLNSIHFINLLNEKANLSIINEKTVSTTKEMKKQMNTSSSNSSSSSKQVNWKSLKLVLELIQSSLVKIDSKMDTDEQQEQQDFIDLIPYLFLILETIETKFLIENQQKQESEEPEEAGSVHDFLYFEIICLNSLLSIYKLNKHTNKSKLDQSKFNIELLMQILQTKRDNEDSADLSIDRIDRLNVQQHILILLSEIAGIFPEKVLEHVLIMFVFVGNKLARKDDSYSFQIISQIIKSILPSIVNSVNNTQDQSESTDRIVKTVNVIKRHEKQLPYVSSLVCKILQSFVVALPHIPAHRKTIIFEQLMNIIGLNDYLWITIIQSIDHYLVQSNDLLDFTQNLEEFTNKQQQLLANNANLAQEKDSNVSKNEKKLRDILKNCLQSMISLHVQFEPSKIVQSSVYLIAFLNKYFTSLFDHAIKTCQSGSYKLDNRKQIYSHLACQLDNYNLLQMKYLAYNLLTFVGDLLISEELVSKLALFYENNSKIDSPNNDYSLLFQNLLEKILVLILKLNQVYGSFESEINKENKNQNLINDMKKFHKAILNKSYDLMEKTINLLDSKQFIMVIKNLINHDLIQIRRRALVLLNNKLRRSEPTEQETTLLMTMIDDLLGSIQLSPSNEVNQVDVEINNQTILFSIKLLCKRIGEQNPLAFTKVLKYLTENLIEHSLYFNSDSIINTNLLSSVLLCIGEVCLKLKSNSLTYLNQIMSFNLEIIDYVRKKIGDFDNLIDNDLIEEFDSSLVKTKSNYSAFKQFDLLALSCVTCLLKVVQNMSSFMSPYLKKVFYVSCSMSHLIILNDNENKAQLSNFEMKLTQLRSTLAKQIPLRLLAPILLEQSGLMIQINQEQLSDRVKIKHIEYYMQIVRLAVQNTNQEDLISNIRTLRSMFMNLFDLRTNYIKQNKALFNNKKTKSKKQNLEAYLTKELNKYEDFIINAFCDLTFKLSEDLFKPIFFKIYEWSSSNNPPKDRLITFYRTTHKLSDKLKNLFVLFAPQFVQNAADLMNQLNSSKTDEIFFEGSTSQKEKENVLLYSIVDTLSNVFLNDLQRTFVNKERFNLLMEPLVDQIENEIEFDDYNNYIMTHLGPCIANLASCLVNEDALLRKFNYQILLKTKHSSVQVRLATLDVLNMFTKKIGDVYNTYLSETVPFLAELMEDPVEEVEDKVQYLIKELEDMLGESLQSHFV